MDTNRVRAVLTWDGNPEAGQDWVDFPELEDAEKDMTALCEEMELQGVELGVAIYWLH